MKASPMSFAEVFAQLEALGTENTRRMYARHGAGENQFGVTMGDLRELAKKLKTNHALALQLWATGNVDAMILATMLMDPNLLSARESVRMITPLSYIKLIDKFIFTVVARTADADELCGRWLDSPEELDGRAGWNLLAARVIHGNVDDWDLDGVLEKIEAGILSAPKRKQEAMNRCLVEIGVHIPEFTQKCLDLGKRLGRFDKTPVPKGCTSSYAPEWIAAVLKRKK